MQFRYPTKLTALQYVQNEAWKHIKIRKCPIHPDQERHFTSHGVYERVDPDGAKIRRYLCHTDNITFSLLPDCFASRLTGTLIDVEKAVSMVEEALIRDGSRPESMGENEISLASLSSRDIADIAEKLNVDCRLFDLAADFRWLRRRIEYVRNVLIAMIIFFPDLFKDCRVSLRSFRLVLGNGPILIQLRSVAESKLHAIPKPVGLNPRLPRPQDMGWKPP